MSVLGAFQVVQKDWRTRRKERKDLRGAPDGQDNSRVRLDATILRPCDAAEDDRELANGCPSGVNERTFPIGFSNAVLGLGSRDIAMKGAPNV